MGTHNLLGRLLPRFQLEPTPVAAATKIKLDAGKPEHELGQISENNYSLDWTPPRHAARQNTNDGRKADGSRRERLPNFYQQWGGREDKTAKYDSGNNLTTVRQKRAIEVALSTGAAQ